MKALSLFANVGIAETYLRDLGIDVVLANELVEQRAKFYSHLYPRCKMICGDITKQNVFDEIVTESKSAGIDLVMATPPCQGMSSLGRKEYDTDQRNFLIFRVFDVIDSLDLDFVIIENVPKFFKMFFNLKKHIPSLDI